jgi:WD40 repeat protein
LKGFEQGIWGVAVSPDGGRVATADSERKVRVWDLGKPGTPGRVLGSHKKEAVCAAFSPDGRRVASGGWDRVARVWDVERGGELAAFEGHADFVWCLAFSPDGRWLATAGLDGTIRLWPSP